MDNPMTQGYTPAANPSQEEREAPETADQRTTEFHVQLAELAGNSALLRSIRVYTQHVERLKHQSDSVH